MYLTKEVDCFVDEEGWHCGNDDENDTKEEDLEWEISNVEMPFHAVN